MENENIIEKEKTNKGLVVLIVILILIVIGLSGYIVYDKFIGKDDNNKTETNGIIEPKTNEEKKVLKKDESKELVYTLYTGKGIDDLDTLVPYININSPDAQEINKKIEDLINNSNYSINGEKTIECKDVIDNTITCPYLKYKSYINNNILSIVIYKDIAMAPSSHQYYTYNIDIYTGKAITNIDLAKLKNINESDFATKLSNTFKEAYPFDKYYPENQYGQEGKDFATQTYNQTIDLKNCSIDNPMFLNENGELNVVLGVYYYAGGESAIYSLINMDNKQFIYYENYKM